MTNPVNSFKVRAKLLKRLGVKFFVDYEYIGTGADRKQVDRELFTSVHLPFSPKEWVSLCQTEGAHYVGGCCGTMSYVQDLLNNVFRFDTGWLPCHKLEEIAQAFVEHNARGKNPNFPFGPLDLTKPIEEWATSVFLARKEWLRFSPWQKMALIWHLVDGYNSSTIPSALRKETPVLEKSIDILASGLQYFNYKSLFSSQDSFKLSQEAKASEIVVLARLLPALKVLNEQIEKLGHPPFTGFALVDTSRGPDEVASNGKGHCLYQTQAEVDKTLKLWAKQKDPPNAGRIVVRPVRVSVEKGIEFLD